MPTIAPHRPVPGCVARLAIALSLVLVLSTGRAAETRDETGKIDDYNQWKQSLGASRATDPATIVATPRLSCRAVALGRKWRGLVDRIGL